MKASMPPSPHTCAGNVCSCSLSRNAECSISGEKHLFEDDDFFLHIDASLQKKRSSVDLQIEEANPGNTAIEASECGSGDKNEEDPSEPSFRESFYSSGTDWSCLYSVDEYGIPCESSDLASVDLCSSKSGELSRQTNSGIKSTKSRHDWVVEKTMSSYGKRGYEAPQKLVQSTLSSCWGGKSHKMGNGATTAEAKTISASEIWAKFKRPPAVPIAIKAQLAVGESTGSKGDMLRPGNFLRKKNCPFYKKIPGTNFTVDAFQFGAVEDCKAYFLTHFHSDHYGGLTKSWVHGPIYCTPVTARLVTLCLYVDQRWIHPLPLGMSHFIDGVEVKMLDANHCPGAAIILFQLKNGQAILHTGDFRACKAMQSYPELRKGSIHTLYLDTTYCNQRYRFPLQKEVINFVVQITQAALKKNSRTLVVVGAYSIGKEHVYLGIAEALNVPIFTESRRSRILGALEWPELVSKLSRDANSTLLHVLPMGHLQPQKLKAYLQGYPKFSSLLAFRPTGWTYSEKIGNELHLLKPVVSGAVTVYGVPYSEHSSFNELQEFVQFLQPKKIIPTVNVGNPQTRHLMQSYFHQWLM
eukprot:c15232_g1_i1 orf=222-1967(+)